MVLHEFLQLLTRVSGLMLHPISMARLEVEVGVNRRSIPTTDYTARAG